LYEQASLVAYRSSATLLIDHQSIDQSINSHGAGMVYWTLVPVVVTYLAATSFHVHETYWTRSGDYFTAIGLWHILCAAGTIKYAICHSM